MDDRFSTSVPATGAVPGSEAAPTAPAASSRTVKRRSSGGRWLNVLMLLALLVAVGGVTFAVGRATAPAQAASLGTGQPQGLSNGQAGGQFPIGSFDPGALPGAFGGDRVISGTVSADDGSSLTLTTADGQTVTVALTGTTFHSQVTATDSDVTQGVAVQVTVTGTGGPGGPIGDSNGGSGNTNGAAGNQVLTATDVTIVEP